MARIHKPVRFPRIHKGVGFSTFGILVTFFCFFCLKRMKEFNYPSALLHRRYLHPKVDEQCIDSELKEIYFGQNFRSLYVEFERKFRVFPYKVDSMAPSLQKIYKTIKLLEMANLSFPSRWRLVETKKTLPSLNLNGQYALEFWLSKWLKQSRFHTLNPEEATAFFVNIQCTALKNTQQKRVPSQRVTQSYIKDLIENIAINMPSIVKRMNFLDHFYMCSHDMGIESIRSTPLNFRTNAIGIVHTADFVGEDSANAAWNTLEDILPFS